MWLLTTFGFFSVVQKAGEDDLTIRARTAGDLDALRERYLPSLSATEEFAGTDYRFRARASHDALGDAMRQIVQDIQYSNFKNEVKKQQGAERAAAYGQVWNVLYSLQDT